jgi:hypothetical protein
MKQSITVGRRKRISSHSFFNREEGKEKKEKWTEERHQTSNSERIFDYHQLHAIVVNQGHRTYHPQLPPKMITMAPVLMCSHSQREREREREFTFLTIWTNEFYQKLPAELQHSPLHGDPPFTERIRKKDPPLSLFLGVTRARRLREDLLGLPPAGGRMITVAPTR